MPAGAPRRPTKQKAVEGTLRTNSADVEVDPDVVALEACIPTQDLDDEERKAFERHVEASLMLESTFRGDADLLTRYAKLSVMWGRVDKSLKKEVELNGGYTYMKASGDPEMHKEARLLVSLSAEMRQLESRLGFSPADRSRVVGAAARNLNGDTDPLGGMVD